MRCENQGIRRVGGSVRGTRGMHYGIGRHSRTGNYDNRSRNPIVRSVDLERCSRNDEYDELRLVNHRGDG